MISWNGNFEFGNMHNISAGEDFWVAETIYVFEKHIVNSENSLSHENFHRWIPVKKIKMSDG